MDIQITLTIMAQTHSIIILQWTDILKCGESQSPVLLLILRLIIYLLIQFILLNILKIMPILSLLILQLKKLN